MSTRSLNPFSAEQIHVLLAITARLHALGVAERRANPRMPRERRRQIDSETHRYSRCLRQFLRELDRRGTGATPMLIYLAMLAVEIPDYLIEVKGPIAITTPAGQVIQVPDGGEFDARGVRYSPSLKLIRIDNATIFADGFER